MAPATKAPSLLLSYAKAGVAALPLAGRLPLIPGGGGPLPTRSWHLADAVVDPATLKRLRELTHDHSTGLPLLAPHMLAFPLHMQAMTDANFPYPAIGTVHLENVVERLRDLPEDERLDFEVRLHGPHPHPKGATFEIETIATADGEQVWREVSTMLRVGARTQKDADEAVSAEFSAADVPESGAVSTTWELPAGLGRAYGQASGDLNPIHLTNLSAKAFGFPRAIIHGMWTAARIAGELGDELPPAVSLALRFQRPIALPATVEFSRWTTGTDTDLLVRNSAGDRIHARGRITPLKPARA